MEAVMMKSTSDNKYRIGNPTWNYGTNRSLFPYPSDNSLLASFLAAGHFPGAGAGFMSMPHPVSGFRPPQNLNHYRQQPPLLPLPNLTPVNYRNTNIARSYSNPNNNNIRSSPPRTNKSVKNRGRDHSLTPKKSKNQKKDLKKEVRDLVPPATAEEKEAPPAENRSTESSIEKTTGPDPKDLPKDIVISRVFIHDDEFSGSAVFIPSPPPSSLPLPTFSLRSKASCKSQASGADVGATDSLRRLLRI